MPITKDKVDLLIIIPPMSGKVTVFPPYGAMYIASALRQKGYNPKILNVDTDRISNREAIRRIRCINPKYIGFSGIVAPSYKYIKGLSIELKDTFPDKIQILGGGLSSAVKPVLENTRIDIVVYGEGDVTIAELIDCLEKKGDLKDVRGLFYKDGPSFRHTGERELVKDMDTLPYPAFDLIDIDRYLPNGAEFINRFPVPVEIKDREISGKKRKMITILTGRGCFAQCSFCFRAYKGIRFHSMKYVFDLVEYCAEKFDAGFFSFGDECFAANKSRHWEFINEYKRRNMDIVFRILGTRVDSIDKDILKAYKEIGCWMIEYGFESGSQKMLNIMDKMVSVEQNKKVAIWTQETGIYTTPTLVLGMPGETNSTIAESIDFLKSLNLNFKQYQWTYALPIPGSPLYEYANLTGAVENEDEYLSSLTGKVGGAGTPHVNITEEPYHVVSKWADRIKSELDIYYFEKRYKNTVLKKIMYFIARIELHSRRKDFHSIVFEKMKMFLRAIFTIPQKQNAARAPIRFQKTKSFNIEDFLKNSDQSSLNRDISLKNINKSIREGKKAWR